VIVHEKNAGKAAAMETGVKHARNSILFFIDGDILRLGHDAMSEAISSVRARASDMYVLIVDREGLVPEYIQKKLPLLGGVRVVRRKVWDAIPEGCKQRFQIELAMNYFARRIGAIIAWRMIPGLSHRIKENKRGWIWGMYQRMFMIRDIALVTTKLYVYYSLQHYFHSLGSLIRNKN
jgi:glycosyltransferase involved in cell wall biosynthesis